MNVGCRGPRVVICGFGRPWSAVDDFLYSLPAVLVLKIYISSGNAYNGPFLQQLGLDPLSDGKETAISLALTDRSGPSSTPRRRTVIPKYCNRKLELVECPYSELQH